MGGRQDGKALRTTAQSFRPLTATERASIMEQRLRIVQAGDGETLAQLSRRSQNTWSNEMTAVVNGLGAGRRLQRGQLVKIAVAQPYRNNR